MVNDGGKANPLVPQHGLSPGFEEERTSRYEGQLQIYCISSLKELKSGGPPAFVVFLKPTISPHKTICVRKFWEAKTLHHQPKSSIQHLLQVPLNILNN
jgi:hypothetical protein